MVRRNAEQADLCALSSSDCLERCGRGYGLSDIQPVITSELVAKDEETGELSLYHGDRDPMAIRAMIMRLKDDLLALGDTAELPVEHEFAKGMYLRKLFIKKGTLLIGKIHRKECINIVAKGDISVLTETGSLRVREGYTVVSPAGIQKLGLAHEDTIFINVFLTNETDIDKIEEEIACESYAALEQPLICEGVTLCQ